MAVLDILIPTYNRGQSLVKNLTLTSFHLRALNKAFCVRIVIVDNCSNDSSFELVSEWIGSSTDIKVEIYRNSENIGLYNNIIKVLSLAKARFIMYLGDDDFIPMAYWESVFRLVESDDQVGLIQPIRKEIRSDFQVAIPLSTGMAFAKSFKPGLLSTLYLASNCNQLSGLVYRNVGLYRRVVEEGVENLYPFMALAGWVLDGYRGYAIHGCPLLITDGVKKDWGYGMDGTLGDILDNVKYFSRNSYVNRVLGEAYFANRWKWFLSIVFRRGTSYFVLCLQTLLRDKRLLLSSRFFLVYLCFYIQTRMIVHNWKNKVLGRKRKASS